MGVDHYPMAFESDDDVVQHLTCFIDSYNERCQTRPSAT